MAGLGLTDNSGDVNGLGINTDHELKAALTQTSVNSGFASLVSEKGVLPNGTRIMKELEASEDFRLRVEGDSLLFADYPTGTALNSSIWTTRLSASQTVVVGSNRYELNSSGLTTVNSGSMLKTARSFQWYKANALYIETALAWTAEPVANWTAEWGLFNTATAIAAITDGVFFRITNGAFRGYCVNSSTETYVDLGTLPAFAQVHDFVIEMCQDVVYFWHEDQLLGKVDVPVAQFGPMGLQQCQYSVRTYNGAVIPATAIKLQVSSIQVSNGGAELNRLWPTVRSGMGGGSYQVPTGAAAGQTANWTNSAAVAGATPTNTTAAFTGLGGQFNCNATAGADTDLHVMKYLVPAGSTLFIHGVRIDTFNAVAAVATTASVMMWGIGVGASADTLAGTEDLVGVKIRRAVPLGIQSFPIGAAIGAVATPIDVNFDSPLCVHGGEYVSFFYKMIVGTATATETFRGTISVNGYFE
jgi:hypothetical protein